MKSKIAQIQNKIKNCKGQLGRKIWENKDFSNSEKYLMLQAELKGILSAQDDFMKMIEEIKIRKYWDVDELKAVYDFKQRVKEKLGAEKDDD